MTSSAPGVTDEIPAATWAATSLARIEPLKDRPISTTRREACNPRISCAGITVAILIAVPDHSECQPEDRR